MIAPAAHFAVPLIKTKLSAPQLRAGLVARPQLLLQLKESAGKPFLLICAPAGYGKTTLLINWIADLKRSPDIGSSTFCWLSLGEGDNEPIRFLSYLVASFETAGIAISAEAHTLLQSTTPPPLQTVLAVLINDLEKLDNPIFLVLDDYQFISNTAIHAGLTFLLDHLPSNVHLVIATRSDPPIPVARLRARGLMDEIRANDLRFSYAETDCLLNQLMDLGLTQEDTTRLEERTEGWIVGLQMAALALKGISQTDYSKISLFVKSFSGSNRYILDYLVEEVLNHQPQEIQDFLLQTSILENLSGPLCDTVTGNLSWKMAEELQNSQQILEYLERTNLFLVALDSDRQWYRYHHLFASLLRSQLRQSMKAPKIQELYCRASQWYESNGLLAEAISQALLSPDLSYAGEILERHILPFFFQSEITQVHRWLELLPETLILQHPLLCAVHAATLALLPPYPPKSLPEAEKWMQAAEQGLSTALQWGDRIRTFIFNIRAYWAYFRSEPPEVVLQLISNASALLPADQSALVDPSQLFIRSALQTLTGLTYWAAGEDQTAEQAFILAQHYSRACNDLLNETASIIKLIEISCLQGRMEEAASICRKALAASERPTAYLRHRTPHSAFIGIQLAEILIEQKKLELVEQLLQENIRLARWNESHDVMLRGHLDLAHLAAMQGDPAAAFEYLNEAEKISEVGAGLAAAHRANLWLTLELREPQYIDLARQWGQNYSLVEFRKCPPQMEWIISLVLAASLPGGGGIRPARQKENGFIQVEGTVGLVGTAEAGHAGTRLGPLGDPTVCHRVSHLPGPGGHIVRSDSSAACAGISSAQWICKHLYGRR